MLITDTFLNSNLTRKEKSYNIRSYDDLTCKSTNVVYGLERNLYGLIYVGNSKGRLNTRMCGPWSGIKNNLFTEVYLCHKKSRICSIVIKHFLDLSAVMTYHRVCWFILYPYQAIDRLSEGSLSKDVESMRTKKFDKYIKSEMEKEIPPNIHRK